MQGRDEILADGTPPLTEGMVNELVALFEWALDGRFSARERQEFQSLMIANWQSGSEKSIQDRVGLTKIASQVAAMPADQRRVAQPQFQSALLKSLQNNSDAGSQLLLTVYRESHEGQRASAADQDSSTTPSVATSGGGDGALGALVGTWQTGSSSSTTYVNRTTGDYSDTGGTQVMYKIFGDGHYEFAALTQQSIYNCTTKLFTYKTGRVAVDGATLTFIPTCGKFTSSDNCNARYNYEKPAQLDRETYNWSTHHDEYGEKLCLRNDKVNGCAYKR
jgi:hypothetical protein